MKKYMIGILTGLLIAGTIGVYAAIKYQASEIEYNDTPLDEVLDDLYSNQKEIETGSVTFTTSSGGWNYQKISFQKEFKTVPEVYIKIPDLSATGYGVKDINTSGFTIGIYPQSWTAYPHVFEWIAISQH